ncbi:MAG: doxx family protein [Thermonemataceae bacterium]
MGIIYTWFGILKFLPEQSPAETLAKDTLYLLSLALVPAHISYFLLALLETCIGILLIINVSRKLVLWLATFHIVCTFAPVFIFTSQVFVKPFVPTLTGQYIIKNLVLFAVILVIKGISKRSALN